MHANVTKALLGTFRKILTEPKTQNSVALTMWGLGIFLDHLFQFDLPDKRKKSLEERMTYSRWISAAHVTHGSPDDPNFPGEEAIDWQRAIKQLCFSKDLLVLRDLEPVLFDSFKLNMIKLAFWINKSLTDAKMRPKSAVTEMKLNFADLAIAESMAVSATKEFYMCYFGGFPVEEDGER